MTAAEFFALLHDRLSDGARRFAAAIVTEDPHPEYSALDHLDGLRDARSGVES